MKLHEVLESGKKYHNRKRKEIDVIYSPNESYEFNISQVLSDKWEIFEEKIELTEQIFDECWDAVFGVYNGDDKKNIKTRLGFKGCV